MKIKEKESGIQRTILDGLAAMHIWAIRMNSGAMFGQHGGKNWAVRFGRKGMADILAIPRVCARCGYCGRDSQPVYANQIWIEVKRPGEKQTPDQLAFQAEVEAEGHSYAVVHSWEEALEALK